MAVLCATTLFQTQAFASGGAGGGGGGTGGGGGGVTTPPPPPLPNPLPTTPPEPGVIIRESFGFGPDNARPNGGKGTMRAVFTNMSISGFWVEWPGSKTTVWRAPETGPQSWTFCGASENWFEGPSPLQAPGMNGCITSAWFDPPVINPTALLPFTQPAGSYEISVDMFPGGRPNSYVAIGLTRSGALNDNLNSVGDVWLLLRSAPVPDSGLNATYELRLNGTTGPLLAQGDVFLVNGFWNPVSLRYDPVSKSVSADVSGISLGAFPVDIAPPSFIAIEGVGIADNLVVRNSP
ncbi:MAG TPA: hypothetical protein VFE90_15735 [Myxococcales bacterium]|nr:hypothetical protein [Myxococcales bacterium]